MEPNEEFCKMLMVIQEEISSGTKAHSHEECLTAALTLICALSRQRLQVQSIVGALEMAKAHTMHEYHEIITNHPPGD